MKRLRVFRHWYRITGSWQLAYIAAFKNWSVSQKTSAILEHRRFCKLVAYECPECVRLSQ